DPVGQAAAAGPAPADPGRRRPHRRHRGRAGADRPRRRPGGRRRPRRRRGGLGGDLAAVVGGQPGPRGGAGRGGGRAAPRRPPVGVQPAGPPHRGVRADVHRGRRRLRRPPRRRLPPAAGGPADRSRVLRAVRRHADGRRGPPRGPRPADAGAHPPLRPGRRGRRSGQGRGGPRATERHHHRRRRDQLRRRPGGRRPGPLLPPADDRAPSPGHPGGRRHLDRHRRRQHRLVRPGPRRPPRRTRQRRGRPRTGLLRPRRHPSDGDRRRRRPRLRPPPRRQPGPRPRRRPPGHLDRGGRAPRAVGGRGGRRGGPGGLRADARPRPPDHRPARPRPRRLRPLRLRWCRPPVRRPLRRRPRGGRAGHPGPGRRVLGVRRRRRRRQGAGGARRRPPPGAGTARRPERRPRPAGRRRLRPARRGRPPGWGVARRHPRRRPPLLPPGPPHRRPRPPAAGRRRPGRRAGRRLRGPLRADRRRRHRPGRDPGGTGVPLRGGGHARRPGPPGGGPVHRAGRHGEPVGVVRRPVGGLPRGPLGPPRPRRRRRRAGLHRVGPDHRGRLPGPVGPERPARQPPAGAVVKADAMTGQVSPIVLEVIRHRLNNINEDAAAILRRVSGSQIAVEANDLNTVIMAADGRVVSCGRYVLIQTASMHLVVADILAHYAEFPGIAEGDQFVTNDPYVGTLRQPDVVVAAPIFLDGTLVAWCASVVHQADVGGPTPGGITYDARSVFDEAIPMPPLKIADGGRLRPDVEREYLIRSRTPELNALDLAGQIAANRETAAQVGALCRRYGTPAVSGALDRLLASGERQVRDRLTALPDGRWRHVAYVVHRGRANGTEEGRDDIYAVRLTMTKHGDRLTLDFSESDDQAPGAINATRPALVNFAMAGVLIYLCNGLSWVPGGVWPAIDIVSREGSVVHARWPAGVAMSTSSTGQAVRVCVNACVARLLESSEALAPLVMASCQFAGAGACVISGVDDTGRVFATMTTDDISGGGGARVGLDGADSSGFTTSPGAAIANVEVNESYLPVRYLLRRELPDSGGAGRWRGGVGTVQLIAPHRAAEPVNV